MNAEMLAPEGNLRAQSQWIDFSVLTGALFLVAHDLNAPLHAEFASYAEYGANAGTGSVGKQVGFILLCIYGLFALWHERRSPLILKRTASLLAAASLFGIATVSILWSIDPHASETRWFGLLSFAVAGAGAAKRLSGREVVQWYVISQTLYLVVGFVDEVMRKTFHPLSAGYRFGGLAHPNVTGTDAAILIFASVAALPGASKPEIYRWTVALGVVSLLLTRSRTALLGAILCFVVVYAILRLRGLRLAMYLYGLVLLASSIIVLNTLGAVNLNKSLSQGRTDASQDALTGRGPLWEELLHDYIAVRPVLGYGYGAFWTPDRIERLSLDQQWNIASAHSSYVDAMLALGMLGWSVYVSLLAALFARALTLARSGRREGLFFSCLLFASMLDGLSESETWYNSSVYLFSIVQAIFVLNTIRMDVRTLPQRNVRRPE